MAKTPHDFYLATNGKYIDVDGWYGAQCPTVGTMITMADGSYKAVELLRPGEMVKGGNRVITNKPRESKLLKVITDTGEFTVSQEHKFVLDTGDCVKAEDLVLGDCIHLDKEIPFQSTTNLTEDELKFLGFYLADGTKKYRHDYSNIPEIFITVGTEEKYKYIEKLDVNLKIRSHSNGKAKIYTLKNSYHKELVNIINYLDGKKLTTNFNAYEYRNIIEGYLKGDGSQKGKNSIVATSTDKELLLSIQLGCLANGWRAKLSSKIEREANNFCDNPKPIYRLTINKFKQSTGKVKKIIDAGVGTIYVLNLDGNHLYFGDNHKHHNCWDLFAYYCQWLGYPVINCGGDGYVHYLWYNRKTSGILNYYNEVTNGKYQDGDVLIWGICSACPYSHVAIFRKDNGNGTVTVLGQNQQANYMNACQINITKSGILGGFRPKCYVNSNANTTTQKATSTKTTSNIPSGFNEQHATFTLTVDSINVRDKASTSGNVVATYEKGQSVNYDCFKADKNGYVWISYISASGKRRYMACGKSKNYCNVEPWGTFK